MQAIIIAHVLTGTFAVGAGALALAARKGAGVHISSGRSFAVLMAISSALGAGLGLLLWETLYITLHAGVLAVYLITSGWLAARSPLGRLGRAGVALGVFNLANFAALVSLGVLATGAADGRYFGFPVENYFFLAGMAGLGAIGDALAFVRKRLSQRHRIARHLWRMCFGFFIAAGSAFTGPGAEAFPEALRESGLLSLPELVIFVLMLFWLARTLFFRPPQAAATD